MELVVHSLTQLFMFCSGYTHHLPVPSQTMTTAHGLYPAHFDNETTNLRGRSK